MLQAAFLSALAGKEVAELAAHAAVTALSEIGEGITTGSLESVLCGAERQGIPIICCGFDREIPITANFFDKSTTANFRHMGCQLHKKGVCLK